MIDEAFPDSISPMLATASATLPDGDDGDWAFELKWDGVRALAYVTGGTARLESRNGNDITARYPELFGLATACPGRDLVLDGEIVAFDAEGRPSFSLLQTRMHVTGPRSVAALVGSTPLAYLIFDLLHLDGRSTRDLPWTDRRRLLEGLGLRGAGWQTPAVHRSDGAAVLAASQSARLEGVVAKRTSSIYTAGKRSRDWLKIKNLCRQELVIGGWLPGSGNRDGRIGALLAGYHDDDGLRFAGKVGTGFTDAELRRLMEALKPLAVDESPFADPIAYGAARFVEPTLVMDVEFTEWTHNGTLRHPSYKGRRDDKAAAEVRREEPDD